MKRQRFLRDELVLRVGYPVIDHMRFDRKMQCFRSFAYAPGPSSFEKLIPFCEENGLHFFVCPDKVYAPEHAVEVRISEAEGKLTPHELFEKRLLAVKATLKKIKVWIAGRKTMDFNLYHAIENAEAWTDRVRGELEILEMKTKREGTSSYFKREGY